MGCKAEENLDSAYAGMTNSGQDFSLPAAAA
jgi:hypothetical protein